MSHSKISLLTISALTLCFAAGCASKKKMDNSSMTTAANNAATETFDPAGSDSQKIDGLHTIHFSFDKSGLNQDDKKLLDQNVTWMTQHPNTKIQIEGHCDQRGSIEYNLGLGERRAKAAQSYMMSQGINQSRLSVISYGKEKPISTGDTDADYAKNRRDNFVPMKN